jgi:hypothetical protein
VSGAVARGAVAPACAASSLELTPAAGMRRWSGAGGVTGKLSCTGKQLSCTGKQLSCTGEQLSCTGKQQQRHARLGQCQRRALRGRLRSPGAPSGGLNLGIARRERGTGTRAWSCAVPCSCMCVLSLDLRGPLWCAHASPPRPALLPAALPPATLRPGPYTPRNPGPANTLLALSQPQPPRAPWSAGCITHL